MTAVNAPTPGTTRPSASSARVPVGGQLDLGAGALERLGGGVHVARAVVEHDDGRSTHGSQRALRRRDAVTRGSSAFAWRNARANALNSASAMWCGSRPASTVTCTVSAGVEGDRLEDVAHHRPGEVAADQVVLEPRRLAGVHEVRPAGDVDDRLRERLVERHERVAVARDAAPCRRAPADGLPEHDADVFDRVVHVDLECRRARAR